MSEKRCNKDDRQFFGLVITVTILIFILNSVRSHWRILGKGMT